ncbi:MAG TPA: hypothetical protein VGY54_20825 [Polyangiaceae bacterium]|jgi:hypothetical protein|nr:hypothetical protein [Polyangiaceae bacterium]
MPVAIAFAPTVVADLAIFGSTDGSGWSDGCMARRGCTVVPGHVPRCAKGISVQGWSDLLASAETLSEKVVHVRGPIGVASMSTRLGVRACSKPMCCNSMAGSVVLGGAPRTLGLEGLFCAGDISLACCNAPAYGETLLATGRLTRESSPTGFAASGWTLTDVSLCTEGPSADPR